MLLHRFALSAFSDALALGMCPEKVFSLAHLFDDVDLVVWVDTPVELALCRKDGSISEAEAGGPYFRRESETLDQSFTRYQDRVRQAYLLLRKKSILAKEWLVVDGTKSIEVSAGKITKKITNIDNSIFKSGSNKYGT
ncbi:hypothetical protein ACQU0X_21225 [Pseudovibrio ascidiaceicola]|uniref:hypothetical protein n=1 Tax=Pseudovibrio ascidiaceicola TaxID=285279 RepID=UPI003D360383